MVEGNGLMREKELADRYARDAYSSWPVATLLDAVVMHAFEAGHAAERKNWSLSEREQYRARAVRAMIMEATGEDEDFEYGAISS